MEQPRPPTIYLLVSHGIPEVAHTLYKIELPLDLSNYEQMIDSDGFMTDSKNISPLLTFKNPTFMPLCASVTLSSKIYYFGGVHIHVTDKRRHRRVYFFDTEHPERGMQNAAPLTRPKMCPCAFVADGMIYALGAFLGPCMSQRTPLPGCKGTGYFERYDPSSDKWEVLPDPPLPNTAWANAQFLDHTTMVGRRVFIGTPFLYCVFNLDDQDWEPPPPLELGNFNCASFFLQHSASLYHLRSPETIEEPVQIIKKGPLNLTTEEQSDYVRNLLASPCLDPDKEQVVAQGTDLDNMFFAHYNFYLDRFLRHMGDRFFCYVATAQLTDVFDHTHDEPNSRGVWIKFFEDVPAETHGGNSKAKFRTLASFCYKIDTDFSNRASFICCSVLGTVPGSWIKAPLEKKLVIKLKPKSLATPAEQENAENREAKDDKKLIAVEEENRRLVAELAKVKELVEMIEISLKNSLSIINVNAEKKQSEVGGSG